MTLPPPSPRQGYQLRLTTVVAITLCAGMLFYLNLTCCWVVDYSDFCDTHYGFPCDASTTRVYRDLAVTTTYINWNGATVNFALAVAIVICAAKLAEFVARPADAE